MKIEIGKKYITRDGTRTVTIEAESTYRGTFRMQGEDDLGRVTWRSPKGRFTTHLHKHDLVAEANEA